MSIIVILCHLLVDFICGLSTLIALGKTKVGLFEIAMSVGIGMFIETIFIAILHYYGLSILMGFVVFMVISIGMLIYLWKVNLTKLSWSEPLLNTKLKLGEILILVIIGEKLIWSILNLAKLPVYFDDTLNHWSGRGKALLTGTNWSWDPDSIYFLGKTFGHMEYPLLASVWRAVNGSLMGGVNTGATERADGLIMWMIIMITATAWITKISGKRWLGLTGAMIISTMPLEAWHMTAGYAEILIQGYLLLSFWAILNKHYVLGGIFGAAMIWSKNEGLILFIPCVILCLCFYLLLSKELNLKEKASAFLKFNLTWLIAISPWLIFKWMNGVGLTIPGDNKLGYVEGALSKMAAALFNAPSSSILWIFLLIGFLVASSRIIKDKQLITMAAGSLILLTMMVFVFTSTGAYIFLENQMTIHRSLLQIAPLFIITIVIALGSRSEPIAKETTTTELI